MIGIISPNNKQKQTKDTFPGLNKNRRIGIIVWRKITIYVVSLYWMFLCYFSACFLNFVHGHCYQLDALRHYGRLMFSSDKVFYKCMCWCFVWNVCWISIYTDRNFIFVIWRMLVLWRTSPSQTWAVHVKRRTPMCHSFDNHCRQTKMHSQNGPIVLNLEIRFSTVIIKLSCSLVLF